MQFPNCVATDQNLAMTMIWSWFELDRNSQSKRTAKIETGPR